MSFDYSLARDFNYALNIEDYSWKNALLFGNSYKHFQKAFTEKSGVHFLIGTVEALPLIGIIGSIFETIIIKSTYQKQIRLYEEKKGKEEFLIDALEAYCLGKKARQDFYTKKEELKQEKIQIKKECTLVLDDETNQKIREFNTKKKETYTCATSGATPVYLLNDLPIVIKLSRNQSENRFHKMQQAHSICKKKGYTHLTIPLARVQGDFIIEAKLPLKGHETKKQMGFYIENRENFIPVVKEFTGFLCYSSFNDILGQSNGDYNKLAKKFGIDVVRYDNIPFYSEDGMIKVGLIDLERFSPINQKYLSNNWCLKRCIEAVQIFPYHLEEILEVAMTFDSAIEKERPLLEKVRDKTLNFFHYVYENHVQHLKDQKISFNNASYFPFLEMSRREVIQSNMVSFIRSENQSNDSRYKEILGPNPDEALKIFEREFPAILDVTLEFLKKTLESKTANQEFTSYLELTSARTVAFQDTGTFNAPKNENPIDKNYRRLKLNIISRLEDLLNLKEREAFSHLEDSKLASLIIQGIFDELVKGKELANYLPDFGHGSDKRCLFF